MKSFIIFALVASLATSSAFPTKGGSYLEQPQQVQSFALPATKGSAMSMPLQSVTPEPLQATQLPAVEHQIQQAPAQLEQPAAPIVQEQPSTFQPQLSTAMPASLQVQSVEQPALHQADLQAQAPLLADAPVSATKTSAPVASDIPAPTKSAAPVASDISAATKQAAPAVEDLQGAQVAHPAPIVQHQASVQLQPVYSTKIMYQPVYRYVPQLVDYKPIEYKSVEYKPVEYKPVEYKPVEYKPVSQATYQPTYQQVAYKPVEHQAFVDAPRKTRQDSLQIAY